MKGVLTRQLRAWVEEFPEIARLESLGRTPQGREIRLLKAGTEAGRVAQAGPGQRDFEDPV